jgi:hypothetical protein
MGVSRVPVLHAMRGFPCLFRAAETPAHLGSRGWSRFARRKRRGSGPVGATRSAAAGTAGALDPGEVAHVGSVRALGRAGV